MRARRRQGSAVRYTSLSQCTHHRLSVKNGKRKSTYGKPDALVASSIGANWRPNTVSRPAVDTETTAKKPTPASFAARIPFNVSSVRSCRCTPAFQMDGMGRQRLKANKSVPVRGCAQHTSEPGAIKYAIEAPARADFNDSTSAKSPLTTVTPAALNSPAAADSVERVTTTTLAGVERLRQSSNSGLAKVA